MLDKRSIKLTKEQTNNCLRFKKSILRFLRVVNNFKLEKSSKEYVTKNIVELRKEVLMIKHASVIFYDFSKDFSNEIEKIKYTKLEDIDKIKVRVRNNYIDSNLRKKLTSNSPKKLLEDKYYSCILFHLAEIYSDYYEYEMILKDILSKKDAIHPDLLLTYLAGDFYMMNWHTFDHIDDLVSFDNGELTYVKGLMGNISDLLEKYDKK